MVSVDAVSDGGYGSEAVERGGGTWRHAGFHVATTIATPAAYAALPFALSSLGWPLGVFSLVLGTLTTWYTSLLIASLWGWNGNKQTTYRSLAQSIFGRWGYFSIACFQQIASLGNNIAIHIAAGSSLKAIYKIYHPDGSLTLQHFIIIFGAFELLLSQFPDIHSLRWLNGLCTLCTLGFAATTIALIINHGKETNREEVSYSVQGSHATKVFGAFNALGTIAFSFGDAMLPEIQSHIREPAKKNMYKGISAAYVAIIFIYWLLAFLGYWSFGSNVQPYILSSLTGPKWTIVLANIFAVVQISGCFQIYCRPTFAYFEERMPASQKPDRHLPSVLIRLAFTSIYIVLITLVAAALPFFGDFVAICGAIGFTPLDFVFPVLAFLKAGRMAERSQVSRMLVIALNVTIAVVFSAVAVLGCIGAVRFITQDVRTYKFFHDM